MKLSVFGYVVVFITIGAFTIPAISAFRAQSTHRLFVADLGTVVLAPIAFGAVGALRAELHTGYALLLWPIIIAVLGMYLFTFRVWVMDAVSSTHHRTSQVLSLGFVGLSIIAALTVPPWYE